MNCYVNDFNTNVKTYYSELQKYTPISKEKELDLIKNAKKNNMLAKHELLTSNLKFVFDMAKKYRGRGVSVDDLIAEGNMGLIKALDKFDESKNVKFISYAVWWVRQYMQELIKKKQLQSSFEISNEDIPILRKDNIITDKVGDDNEGDNELLDANFIATDNDEYSYDLKQRQASAINSLLCKLPERAQFIIKAYYGFGQTEMTLEEIGEEVGLSKERVRQIRDKNIRILRSEVLMLDNFNDLFSN